MASVNAIGLVTAVATGSAETTAEAQDTGRNGAATLLAGIVEAPALLEAVYRALNRPRTGT